ncbi:MAG: carboxypeptidase-like regulatory domain-containing protein [Myxococcota bacterium]
MKRLSIALIGLILLGLLGLWMSQPEDLHPTTETKAALSERPSQEQAEPDAVQRLDEQVRFEVLVIDETKEPVLGVPVSSTVPDHPERGEVWGETDADGKLTVTVPRGTETVDFDVGDGWWLSERRHHLQSIESFGYERRLIVSESCPGRILVVDVEGVPVPDAEVSIYTLGSNNSLVTRTNAEGDVFVPNRPCGQATVIADKYPSMISVWAEILDDELITLRLEPERFGLLTVVDGDGAMVDVKIWEDPPDTQYPNCAPVRGHVETLSKGRFRVESPVFMSKLCLRADGYPQQAAKLPMDGREHFYTMRPAQVVTIHVICTDQCPDEVMCGGGTGAAAQIEDNKYQCNFSPSISQPFRLVVARIYNEEGRIIKEPFLEHIQPEQTAVIMDLASPPEQVASHIIGSWGGDLPCDMHTIGPSDKLEFDEQCNFSVYYRGNKHNRLEISGPPESGQRALIHLQGPPGKTTDLGEIYPGEQEISGVIESDFPLGHPYMGSNIGYVTLGPEGHFTVHDVRHGIDRITLSIQHVGSNPFHGDLFSKTFDLREGKELYWFVDLTEGGNTTLAPETPDTGL